VLAVLCGNPHLTTTQARPSVENKFIQKTHPVFLYQQFVDALLILLIAFEVFTKTDSFATMAPP
jgi:hypothetical protein